MSRAALTWSERNYALVHAGVAATPAGDGVLLTGESGSGKTTIVAALVQEGYAFLSDETAVVDLESSQLHPWTRPLDFKPGGQLIGRFRELFDSPGERAWHVSAQRVRPGSLGQPCAARLILDYRHDPGAPTTLEPISRGGALALLGSATPGLRHLGERGLVALRNAVAGASAFRLRSGDLDDAVRCVRRLAEH